MHTPLQILERNVLRNLVTSHPIYTIVKDMVLELDEQCLHFHLTPEDVFLEIIDLIDETRSFCDVSPDKEVMEQCRRLHSHYKRISPNYEAVKDIKLWMAVIIYSTSCAISIVKTKPYKSTATLLRTHISQEHTKLLLPYLSKAISKLTNEQFAQWDHYFLSDEYLSEELINCLEQADYCEYIVRETFINNTVYTLDSYEKQLKIACSKGAPYLICTLKRGETLNYLDFKGDDLKTIYDTLVKHFPNSIDYRYKHFANTAKEHEWHSRKKTKQE